jgi:DNA polymerase III epsilon subunit-like protein
MFGTSFFPFSYHVRDILQRAIFWCEENDKRPENLKLSTMCAYFGIPTDGQHDALTDVRLCAALYRKLAAK